MELSSAVDTHNEERMKFLEARDEVDWNFTPGCMGPTLTERFFRWVGLQISAKKWHWIQRISSYIGVFLIFTPVGVAWYWGNIVVYTDSYFRNINGPEGDSASTWILAVYLIVWTIGIPASDNIRKLLGPTLAQLSFCAIFEVAMFSSYFTIQYSQIALIFTFGVLGGFSGGCIYGQNLWIITEWTDKNTGFVTATLDIGFYGGSMIVSLFVTHLLNPENFTPDLESGPRKYFTQETLLERVPSFFITLGIYTASFHIMGMLLVWRRKDSSKECFKEVGKSSNNEETHILINGELCSYVDEKIRDDHIGNMKVSEEQVRDILASPTLTTNGHLKDGRQNDKGKSVYNEREDMELEYSPEMKKDYAIVPIVTDLGQPMTVENQKLKSVIETTSAYYGKDLTPLEVLRTVSFYVMWLALVCGDLCYVVMVNFYKAFGQLYIHDDHFLSNITFFTCIAVIATKSLWGIVLDKKGAKFTLISVLTIQSLNVGFWYFTPLLNRWLFVATTTLFAVVNAGIYLQVFVCTLIVFGKTHFLHNYGLVISAGMVANLMAPTVLEFIANSFGWFATFISVGYFNVVGLILVVCKMPEV